MNWWPGAGTARRSRGTGGCRSCVRRTGPTRPVAAAVVRDVASGAFPARPGLEQVRAMIRNGEVDLLLAYAVDRLSREQTHTLILLDEASR